MNIIGLGKAGCKITQCFEKYSQYKCYKIDVGLEGERCYNFPFYETTEEYETKLPSLENFLGGLKGETLFILAGGGAISTASLRILEELNHKEVTILYVQPEIELLTGVQVLRERLVRGVLQQYARSAVFKRIYLVSNPELEKIIGEVPIMSYFDKLNEALASTLHMIHVFQKASPVVGKMELPRDVCKISTFGIFDSENDEEKMFFPLDNPRDVCYIYGVNKEKLQNDGTLFRSIVNQMKTKLSKTTNISYAVFETKYKKDISYCIAHASYVQP